MSKTLPTYECTEKTSLEEWRGAYVGCARHPTYAGPLLAVDLFSVESLIRY